MAVDQYYPSRPEGGPGTLFRFRCTTCAYGASCRAAPERCPMCGCSTWEYEGWRPVFAILDDIGPNGALTESKL
jgi:hypothetical protein